jgi:hypothetical protein
MKLKNAVMLCRPGILTTHPRGKNFHIDENMTSWTLINSKEVLAQLIKMSLMIIIGREPAITRNQRKYVAGLQNA